MSKGPFGLRRLSDALDFLTPKKFKRKYRKEDEEDVLALTPLRTVEIEEEEEGERPPLQRSLFPSDAHEAESTNHGETQGLFANYSCKLLMWLINQLSFLNNKFTLFANYSCKLLMWLINLAPRIRRSTSSTSRPPARGEEEMFNTAGYEG